MKVFVKAKKFNLQLKKIHYIESIFFQLKKTTSFIAAVCENKTLGNFCDKVIENIEYFESLKK